MPIHSALFFYVSAILIGVVAGMRSMMAPAIFALTMARRPALAPATAPIQWFALRPIAIILGVATLGELIADKLPWTPNRTAVGPFAVRVASGAFTGAALVQIGRINPWIGAVCGAVGAIAGTFGAFYARRSAGRITEIRDPFVGVLEDVIAIALAVTVVSSLVG